jgi:hypothetical protein
MNEPPKRGRPKALTGTKPKRGADKSETKAAEEKRVAELREIAVLALMDHQSP